MSIEPTRIVLHDDGSPFRYEDIFVQQRTSGGAAAFRHMLSSYSNHVVLSQKHYAESNELTIALIHSIGDIPSVTDCFHEPSRTEIYSSQLAVPSLPLCNKVYLLLPIHCTYSDVFGLIFALSRAKADPKRYIIVGQGLSDGLVAECGKQLTGCQFMNLQ